MFRVGDSAVGLKTPRGEGGPTAKFKSTGALVMIVESVSGQHGVGLSLDVHAAHTGGDPYIRTLPRFQSRIPESIVHRDSVR